MLHYHEQGASVGIEKPRAYFIPFERGQQRSERREESNLFRSLCGEWKIRAYETVLAAENFLDETPEEKIGVPSCVQ